MTDSTNVNAIQKVFVTVFLLFGLMLPATGLSASTVTTCQSIDAIPYTINRPGRWCLNKDLRRFILDGVGITIRSNNVDLDLNQQQIFNEKIRQISMGILANSASIGIYVRGNNVTVRNGTISGFNRGVLIAGHNSRLTGLRVINNREKGIEIRSSGTIVEDNYVGTVGNRPQVTSQVIGISVIDSDGVLILDNKVHDVRRRNEILNSSSSISVNIERGIRIRNSRSVVVEGNFLTNSGDVGIQIVGFRAAGGYIQVAKNRIVSEGPDAEFGITTFGANALIVENYVSGYGRLMTGGSDGGGNVHQQ